MNLTKKDMIILTQCTDEELMSIYSKLNIYEVPSQFEHYTDIILSDKNISPKNYVRNIICVIQEYCENQVGRKAILKEHNKDSMTPEEFEDFYNGTYNKDIEAKERYEIKSLKEVCKDIDYLDKINWNHHSSIIKLDILRLERENFISKIKWTNDTFKNNFSRLNWFNKYNWD